VRPAGGLGLRGCELRPPLCVTAHSVLLRLFGGMMAAWHICQPQPMHALNAYTAPAQRLRPAL
jgi:hypothetical protein